ncbi:hypothetical protein GQ53DRAFT_751092 [Thozetella sp. PMI_491]|nr:hypothetical protein GQ53DRAFT_751092 [Thozetella sp. PMI_491]
MSGHSQVGTSGVYEAGDQRKAKNEEAPTATRYHEGNPNAHDPLDSKDQRSIANRLAAEEQRSGSQNDQSRETQLHKEDPRLPAVMHGNEPSRGAKIDAELKAEEEEVLAKKKH